MKIKLGRQNASRYNDYPIYRFISSNVEAKARPGPQLVCKTSYECRLLCNLALLQVKNFLARLPKIVTLVFLLSIHSKAEL